MYLCVFLREAKENTKLQREEAVQKRNEEREKTEEETLENRDDDANTDTKETKAYLLEISEEGKEMLKRHDYSAE